MFVVMWLMLAVSPMIAVGSFVNDFLDTSVATQTTQDDCNVSIDTMRSAVVFAAGKITGGEYVEFSGEDAQKLAALWREEVEADHVFVVWAPNKHSWVVIFSNHGLACTPQSVLATDAQMWLYEAGLKLSPWKPD